VYQLRCQLLMEMSTYMVCKGIEARTRPPEVVGSRRNILMATASCNIDVLCFGVEDGHWFEECCSCTCTTSTLAFFEKSYGLFSSFQQRRIMSGSIQDGSRPGIGEGGCHSNKG
jgi:hypothetical protein